MINRQQWSGRPIRMPGIYHGVPIDIYHSGKVCVEPSISSSGLRTIFGKSEKHYWCHSPYNPKRIEKEETKALTLGRAAHHLLFGEKNFAKSYIVRPPTLGGEKWHGSRIACKLWVQDKAEKGLSVITVEQKEAIAGIAESLQEVPLVQAGILNGDIEHSWFCKDRETGVWLKIRPDASPNDSLDFADLKLTRSIFQDDLRRAIREYGYYQQAGLCAEVCKEVTGQPLNSFSFVFCENEPPYCVKVVTLEPEDISRGIHANRNALRRFAKAMETGKWLGPGGEQRDAEWITLRDYDRKRIDEELGEVA